MESLSNQYRIPNTHSKGRTASEDTDSGGLISPPTTYSQSTSTSTLHESAADGKNDLNAKHIPTHTATITCIDVGPTNISPSPGDFVFLSPPAITPESYHSDTIALRTRLLELCPKWPQNMYVSLSPYGVYTPPSRITELRTLHTALHAALLALVNSWWTRPALSQAIPVPEKIERTLRILGDVRRYDGLGFLRPDFIIPREQGAKLRICEINARFLFNGNIVRAMHGDAMVEVGEASEWAAGERYGMGIGLTELRSHFTQYFEPEKPIALVTEKEGVKWDLNFIKDMYPTSRVIRPGDLYVMHDPKTGEVTGLADSHGTITRALLELHQEELEALDEQVLFELGKICYNDLRTIYFIHDKRMLGLLRQELPWLVDARKITEEQAQVLSDGLAETYLLDDGESNSNLFRQLRVFEEKDNWTLKKARSGKGDGMVFGKDIDENTWRGLIAKYSKSAHVVAGGPPPYVLQRYIPSKKLDLLIHITTPEAVQQPVEMGRATWNIVGTMACMDRVITSNIFYRANATDIVAVGRQGLAYNAVSEREFMSPYTVPMAVAETSTAALGQTPLKRLLVPTDARIPAPMLGGHKEQVKQVKRALKTHGLAVVDLGFEDKESAYMVGLTGMLGEPLDHSWKQGILWDVRPVEGLNAKNAARSETMEPFPWHTDCSFEHAPPRYFALHVLHEDRYGGGNLRLLHVDSLIAQLRPTTRETLRLPHFKFLVPKEFHKSTDHIIGPLLFTDPRTGHQKLRYRREVMEGLTPQAEQALAEVEERLEEVDAAGDQGPVRLLGEDVMRDGVVVLLDNARWLHARSPVRDQDRWLRRVRWAPEQFGKSSGEGSRLKG